MIDIHMIDSGRYPTEAENQRVTMRHPLVKLQAAEYVHRNMREARYKGFGLGTNPYVSWIDDDDEVLDVSWLEQAVTLLENDPTIAGVYPRYETYHRGRVISQLPLQEPWTAELHRSPPPVAHHLTIMRRENVMAIHELLKANQIMTREQDVLLTQAQLRFGRMVPLPNIAYRWHLRPGGVRLLNDGVQVRSWSYSFTDETFRQHYQLAANEYIRELAYS